MATPRSDADAARAVRVRLFVALDLPDAARRALDQWRLRAFESRADVRLPAAESLHVTLAFLGQRDAGDVAVIAGLLREVADAARPAPVLTAVAVNAIPPRRPRLFALDLADDGGRAGALHSALSQRLERAKLYEPEDRPFWPHLTLARVRKGERAGPLRADPPPAEPWPAAAITLYRSHLGPRGARYEPLEQVRFS